MRTHKRVNTISIFLSALLCALLRATGKLEGNFEFSQTYMLLYLCIRSALEES